MKIFLRCMLLALTVAPLAFAQTPMAPMTDHGVSVNGKPLASPPAVAETVLEGKKITIHYNAPSLRGRVMIGEHDPYNKVWRTGANPATSFVTEANLKVGDLFVPAGGYTLYTLPEPTGTPWLLILNKQTGQWGTVYNQSLDLGRTPMLETPLPESQEVMSISLEHAHGGTAELHIRWARIDESVKISLAK